VFRIFSTKLHITTAIHFSSRNEAFDKMDLFLCQITHFDAHGLLPVRINLRTLRQTTIKNRKTLSEIIERRTNSLIFATMGHCIFLLNFSTYDYLQYLMKSFFIFWDNWSFFTINALLVRYVRNIRGDEKFFLVIIFTSPNIAAWHFHFCLFITIITFNYLFNFIIIVNCLLRFKNSNFSPFVLSHKHQKCNL